MPTEILMPKIGLNMREGLLVEWLVEEGSFVKENQPLYTVETEKVTNEVLAEVSGKVHQIINAGMMVPVSGVVGLIFQENEPYIVDAKVVSDVKILQSESSISPELSENIPEQSNKVIATPAARRKAQELGISISKVFGSNPDGSISLDDILAFAKNEKESTSIQMITATPVAVKMAEELGIDLAEVNHDVGKKITKEDVEKVYQTRNQKTIIDNSKSLTGIRKVIAERMHTSSIETAPVTIFTECDATRFFEFRALKNKQASMNEIIEKLSLNAMFVFVVARAINDLPYINSKYEKGVILQQNEINIGVAVDTDKGLIVPVIRNAKNKNLEEVNLELTQKIERAQKGLSSIDDLTGGTFTITNLGNYEIDGFTPIINLPEMAILGIGRIQDKVVGIDGLIGIQKRITLSLTFDHRFIDGAPAAKFLKRISELLINFNEVG